MLEWEIASGEQTQLEIIAALQGTELGQQYYKDLCERQQTLQRLVRYLIIFYVCYLRTFDWVNLFRLFFYLKACRADPI